MQVGRAVVVYSAEVTVRYVGGSLGGIRTKDLHKLLLGPGRKHDDGHNEGRYEVFPENDCRTAARDTILDDCP